MHCGSLQQRLVLLPLSEDSLAWDFVCLQSLDLSQIILQNAIRSHFNAVEPIPDESLALLDVQPDDPRQEENSNRKPLFDRGLQLMSEVIIETSTNLADLKPSSFQNCLLIQLGKLHSATNDFFRSTTLLASLF